jgi:hypothetical protein
MHTATWKVMWSIQLVLKDHIPSLMMIAPSKDNSAASLMRIIPSKDSTCAISLTRMVPYEDSMSSLMRMTLPMCQSMTTVIKQIQSLLIQTK